MFGPCRHDAWAIKRETSFRGAGTPSRLRDGDPDREPGTHEHRPEKYSNDAIRVPRTRCSAQRCTADPGPMLRQNGSRFCNAPLRAALRPGHEAVQSSRPFRAGLGGEIDGALDPDIVEMRVEEVARRAAAAVAQHHEEIIVGAQLAVGRELAEGVA